MSTQPRPTPVMACAHPVKLPCMNTAHLPAETALRVHSIETFGTHDGRASGW